MPTQKEKEWLGGCLRGLLTRQKKGGKKKRGGQKKKDRLKLYEVLIIREKSKPTGPLEEKGEKVKP